MLIYETKLMMEFQQSRIDVEGSLAAPAAASTEEALASFGRSAEIMKGHLCIVSAFLEEGMYRTL